ncbi:MAG: serine hydrolase domain-containing protein [Candidatus Thorarchaeota archaeon]|jgi:CubicO group peptidase (beta-lactamase class C family)
MNEGSNRVVLLSILLLVVSTLLIDSMHTDNASALSPVGNAWLVSEPEEQNMNSTLLEAAEAHILDNAEADVNSLIVIRNGYIVFERYFRPYLFDANDPNVMYSITKTVIALLIGIAIELDFLEGVDQRVLDFFPNSTFADTNAWKEAITIEHLLTMTSGLRWIERGYLSYGPEAVAEGEDLIRYLFGSVDWVQNVLDRPMTAEPGTTFQNSTGMTAAEFAEDHLFEPLGITSPAWLHNPRGETHGATGLTLTPRDLAKIGLLCLNNGLWDERQVVPSEWITESFRSFISTNHSLDFGYQWWIHNESSFISAKGFQGQAVYLLPEQDIVVVFTSTMIDAWLSLDDIIEDFIIPAVLDPSDLSLTVVIASSFVLTLVIFAVAYRRRKI